MDNTGTSDPTRLLILGNGFDLQAGLKSSFNDYYDSLESDTFSNFEKKIELLYNGDSGFYDSFIQTLIECFDWDPSQSLKRMIPSTTLDLSFWEYLLVIKRCESKESNWADVENNIQDFICNSADSFISLKQDLRKNNLDRFFNEKNKTSSILTSILLVSFGLSCISNSDQFYSFLLDQLDKFEDNFRRYLTDQLKEETIRNNYHKNSNRILDVLEHGEQSNILTFNYTSPLQLNEVTSKTSLTVNTRNVHGDLSNKIIIGIDQKAEELNQETELTKLRQQNNYIYLFSKTYRIMRLASDRYEKHILDKNIKSVVFYGHSLAAADYSYFQSIFDFYSIYDSDVALVFYYSIYDENKKEEIIKTQFDSIRKLLLEYGDTLDNKDHGKNLLHKLLLEDRLIIKELVLDDSNHEEK